MKADMIFGWKPTYNKLEFNILSVAKPVASLDLRFKDPNVCFDLIYQIGKRRALQSFEPKLIFKGFRPETTSQLHYS